MTRWVSDDARRRAQQQELERALEQLQRAVDTLWIALAGEFGVIVFLAFHGPLK